MTGKVSREEQKTIVQAWLDWYRSALKTTDDIEVGGTSAETMATIRAAVARVTAAGEEYLNAL